MFSLERKELLVCILAPEFVENGRELSQEEINYNKDNSIDQEADEKKILKFTGGKFSHINIGTGKDYSINEVAKIVKKISGFKGEIINNKNYSDGVKRKVLNINLFNKICPNSNNSSKKNFVENIKKVYRKLNDKKFNSNKKWENYYHWGAK